MLNTIVVLVLLAAVLWVAWELWKNGWDIKKAAAAVVAAAAAAWMWMSDALTSLTSGM